MQTWLLQMGFIHKLENMRKHSLKAPRVTHATKDSERPGSIYVVHFNKKQCLNVLTQSCNASNVQILRVFSRVTFDHQT